MPIQVKGMELFVQLPPFDISSFTCTGTHQFIDEGGGNWSIRITDNGVFTPLVGVLIDAFVVGGGGDGAIGAASDYAAGGGGGGGYTKTAFNMSLTKDVGYNAVIGAGGAVAGATGYAKSGAASSFNGVIADGGKGGQNAWVVSGSGYSGFGGVGASGGGAGGGYSSGGIGGSDGSDGTKNGSSGAGKGQGTTTGEFGDATKTKYSAGGGGGGVNYDTAGGAGGVPGGGKGGDFKVNGSNATSYGSGGGGAGARATVGGTGYQGIVTIRNHRAA